MSVFDTIGRGGNFGGFGGGGAGGGTGIVQFQMLAEVRAYWDGLRNGDMLPARDQIDPRGIAGALESTFLVERVAPRVARFRLAGMQLHDLMGMDVRGMPLTALIEPAGRNRLSNAVEAVFANPEITEVALKGERGIGRPPLQGHMLLLPLVSTRGVTDLALGCLAMEGNLGRAPRRFAISGVLIEELCPRYDTQHTLDHARALRRNNVLAASGMAEDEAPFAATPRPPHGKPHLRLVSSRD